MKKQMKQRMNGYLRAGLLLGGVLTALIVLGFFWTPYDPQCHGRRRGEVPGPVFSAPFGNG